MNELLWNSMLIAGPVLGAALAIGLIISVLQVATQLQEMTLSYVPKTLGCGCCPARFGALDDVSGNPIRYRDDRAHSIAWLRSMVSQALSDWLISCLVLGLRIALVFAFAPPFTLVRIPLLFRVLLGFGLSIGVLNAHSGQRPYPSN
ncbi:MAG: flagellar biosynthetic protein FliQ [Rhizomicrobium sp.]